MQFRAFDNEEPKKRPKIDAMTWTEYHNLETIHAWLDSLQEEFPNFVNVTSIGSSSQGRQMKLLKLSKKAVRRNLKANLINLD